MYDRAGRLHQVLDEGRVVSTYEYFPSGALMRQTLKFFFTCFIGIVKPVKHHA